MIAIYCATKNLYKNLEIAVYSLKKNNPAIDVICVIEDNSEPFKMDGVKFVNVYDYKRYVWFEGINAKSVWTYMATIRLQFHKMFDYDKVLYLDADTIVNGDITELWEYDLTDYAVAGVKERTRVLEQGVAYINSGVLLMNLDYLRKSKLGDKLIKEINTEKRYLYPDQDIINLVCKDKILIIPSKYNECLGTAISAYPRIVHYAGRNNNPYSDERKQYWINYLEQRSHDLSEIEKSR